MNRSVFGILAAGVCAGCINGIFGAGGGMVLIPILCLFSCLEEKYRFPCSVAMMLPMCIISLWITTTQTELPWEIALPYMAGGTLGGLIAGKIGDKIPVFWLHKILGLLILWGGIRYIW